MLQNNHNVLLNNFAIRSFRDTADRDYIHARLAYRARLVPQFQWSSLHCLEKYAKCILLLNRISSKKVRHRVTMALNLVATQGRFEVSLSDATKKFIKRLESGAEFRYFEISYSNEHFDITRLDLAVSELRRYCQSLDYSITTAEGSQSMLKPMLARIHRAANGELRDTCILNGWLEGIINDREHPAREPLVWQNLYFGLSKRHTVKLQGYMEAGNSPLYLHPEILDEVLEYVYIPDRVVKGWRLELTQRACAAEQVVQP
jgi:hypothetical protein